MNRDAFLFAVLSGKKKWQIYEACHLERTDGAWQICVCSAVFLASPLAQEERIKVRSWSHATHGLFE